MVEAVDNIKYRFLRLRTGYNKQGIKCLEYHPWIFDSRSREFYDFEQSLSILRDVENRTLRGVLQISKASEQLKQSIESYLQN